VEIRRAARAARVDAGPLCRIARSSNDQPVNHFARMLDAIGWDVAAMSVAQKHAGYLRKLGGICGLRDATPEQRRQLKRNDYDGSSWTHGKPHPEGPRRGNDRAGDFVSATGPKCRFAAFRRVIFWTLASRSVAGSASADTGNNDTLGVVTEMHGACREDPLPQDGF
jgi:hypothetical protein